MNAPQRTPEWFKEREGKLTGSAFGQAAGLAPGSRQQLWRRLMGLEVFEGNEATEWGNDHEDVAHEQYKIVTGVETELTGFVVHPNFKWLGCSPDLLVGDQGLGEIKCPFNQKIYEQIPPYYMAQMQGQLEITNREWCDFIVWTPQQMSIQRVWRSTQYWDWLHIRLADFWCWVQAKVEPPREKKPTLPKFDVRIEEPTLIALT